MKVRRQIEEQQRVWAAARGIALTGGNAEAPQARVVQLDDNLFQPLDEKTRDQFLRGAGGELTWPDGASGHLYSLASSQALCVNVLLPWRGRSAEVVSALGLDAEPDYIWEFDARLRFSPKRTETAPVDLLLKARNPGPSSTALAVEAKFAEPYDGKPRRVLGHYYRTRKDLIAGWTHIARLVRDQEEERRFRYFDLAQGVRQLMGLRQTFGRTRFVLLYLWYRAAGRDGTQFAAELDEFRHLARQDGIAFIPCAWNELVKSLGGEPEWRAYLKERYGL
jgi:hypothetical protein